MTIDEAIKCHKDNYQTFIDCLWDGNEENNPYDEAFKMAINALEELKWYREQDLVNWLDVEELVQQIPKAEPPNSSEIKRELNETKNERNGDCETCKHYGDERHCRDCYSRYNEDPACYEPYIPKE